jgi:hypothetical protein
MTIRLLSVFLAALLAVTVACNDDKNNDQDNSSCDYCTCCETTPVSDAFQAGGAIAQVYIPNIIVLGSSEVANASFTVFGNSQIEKIETVKLLDANGGLLFGGVELEVNQPIWDGVISTDATGAINTHDGSFEYIVNVRTVSGLTKTYTGTACVVQCADTAGFPQSNLSKCGFPVQNNNGAFGGGNPAIVQECF